jgi:hypothetical protein
LYPKGTVDALHMLANSQIYGFNPNCQRTDQYIKLFGTAQDFDLLIRTDTNTVVQQLIASIEKVNIKKVIIDWKYIPEPSNQDATMRWLDTFSNSLKDRNYKVFLKAPASYFCRSYNYKKYLVDLAIQSYIIEMYGERPGAYVTIDSIFG